MTKPKLIIVFFIFLTSILRGQSWEYFYGSNADSSYLFSHILALADGGYLLTGRASYFSAGTASKHNLYVVRTDAQGRALWERNFRNLPASQVAGHAEAAFGDGDVGYLIFGQVRNEATNNAQIFSLSLDYQGNTIQLKTFGDSLKINSFGSLLATNDGHVMVAFSEGDHISQNIGTLNICLGKFTSSGDSVWIKKYTHFEGKVTGSILQTPDNGFLIISDSTTLKQTNQRSAQGILLKVNAQGDPLWTKNPMNAMTKLAPLSTTDMWVTSPSRVGRMSHNGNLIWRKLAFTDYWQGLTRAAGNASVLRRDGNMASFATILVDNVYQTSYIGFANDGRIVWDRNIPQTTAQGNYIFSATQSRGNDCMVVAGYNSSQLPSFSNKAWLSQLDNCTVSTSEIATQPLKIAPNPAQASTTLTLPDDFGYTQNQFKIYDLAGHLLHQKTFEGNTFTFERGSLVSGVYFLVVHTEGGKIFREKVVFY